MKNKNSSYLKSCFVVFLGLFLFSASSGIAQGLFQLNGNGGQADLGNNCYRLTQAVNNQNGSMWYRKKADLNQDFDMSANLNFGTLDGGGADGIVFAFQDVCTSAGGVGGGIGIAGVTPSFFVEFDTWSNGNYNDPVYDHLGILKNGDVNHASGNSLVAPTGIVSGNGNVENGQDYLVRIWWTAGDSTLRVYVNNDLRATYSGNVINSIFNGNPYVYWGFTAATGGSYNVHQVCIVNFPTNEIELQDATICLGDSTQANLPGGVTYSWTPNYNISSTSVSNPYLFPAVNTTYIVSITDACNNVQTDTIDVVVNPLPVVQLGISTNSICENAPPFSLSGGSPAGGIYSIAGLGVQSSFDPTQTGTGNVVVNYSYTDTLGCTNTVNDVVTVNPAPVVSLNPFNALCENDTPIALTGGTPSGGTYTGPGVSNNIFSPALAGPGTHSITYTYSNGSGCSAGADNTIDVNPAPSAVINAPTGTVICSGSSILLSTNPISGVSYQWWMDGVPVTSSSPANTSYTVLAPGDYQLRAESGLACVTLSSVITITSGVNPNPVISNTANDFCPGDSLALTGNLTSGESGQWLFNGNPIPGAIANVYYANAAGNYSLQVISSSGCVSISNVLTLIELSNVTPNLTSSAAGFCPGTTSITLTANSAPGATYEWYQNGSLISGAITDTYVTTMDGNYYVVVTATSGCSATSSVITLNMSANPVVTLSAGNLSFCQGSSTTLDAGSGAGLSYSWYYNGSVTAGNSNTLSVNQSGDYYVVATNAAGCSGTSNTIQITELPAPVAGISSNGTTFCPGSSLTVTANSVNGATYEWFMNNVSQGAPTLNNTSFNVTQSGTYYVVISNGCSSTSNSITINSGQLPGSAGTIFGTGFNIFCPGESYFLSISNVPGASYYNWSVSPGNAATISVGQGTTDITLNMLNQNATITVTPVNACGTGGSSSETLQVDDPAFCFGVNFAASSTNPCQGSTVTYFNYTDNSNYPGSTISWDFGPGASPSTATGNGPITVTYSTPGLHTTGLYYLDQFGFVIDQEVKYDYIVVSGVVNTSAISGNVTLPSCSGAIETYSVQNTPGSSYQWTVPANASILGGQGSNQISVNFSGSGGVITVTETTLSGCVGSLVSISVNCVTGLEGSTSEAATVHVFPNPGSGIIQLSFETVEHLHYEISLLDMSGKEIYRFAGSQEGSFLQQYDFSSLSNGMYLLRVNIGNQMTHKLLVISK